MKFIKSFYDSYSLSLWLYFMVVLFIYLIPKAIVDTDGVVISDINRLFAFVLSFPFSLMIGSFMIQFIDTISNRR